MDTNKRLNLKEKSIEELFKISQQFIENLKNVGFDFDVEHRDAFFEIMWYLRDCPEIFQQFLESQLVRFSKHQRLIFLCLFLLEGIFSKYDKEKVISLFKEFPRA